VLLVLDTVAVNCRVPPDTTVAEMGEIETATGLGGAVMETEVLADFVGSATLVAVTVAVLWAVTAGAV
jgi:hypothetical protein